jgi:hypothetical protein
VTEAIKAADNKDAALTSFFSTSSSSYSPSPSSSPIFSSIDPGVSVSSAIDPAALDPAAPDPEVSVSFSTINSPGL